MTRIARKKSPDDTAAQKEYIDRVFSNIATTTSAQEAASFPDLIIEAIVENLKTKQDLFRRLDEIAPRDTIFASNTSSLSVRKIAEPVSDARKERFCALHFFSPVPQMRLVSRAHPLVSGTGWRKTGRATDRSLLHDAQLSQVEIISTDKTAPGVLEDVVEVCKRMKKTPVRCGDTPGSVAPLPILTTQASADLFPSPHSRRFIVNRLLVPYLLEAVRMVERGEATPEDIDAAMKLGAGVPMGA